MQFTYFTFLLSKKAKLCEKSTVPDIENLKSTHYMKYKGIRNVYSEIACSTIKLMLLWKNTQQEK